MVDVSEPANPGRAAPSPEQLRYARLLDYGMKAGLAVLVLGFLLYATGALPALVPFDALPRLWTLPVDAYVRESGMVTGWNWVFLLDRGDIAATLGVALLAGVSLPCLAMLVPAYARNRDWLYLAITLTLVGVLVISGSGVLVSH